MTESEWLQRALADACLEAEADRAIAADVVSYLRARGVDDGDVQAIAASPPRMAVYRDLVRNGLLSVTTRLLPRTRARLNRASAGRFDADFARFLEEVGPRTHYLRDVPAELFAWARPRWEQDPAVPPYLIDLAAHELDAFAIGAAAVGPRRASGPVRIDRGLALHPSVRVVRRAWAVHRLATDAQANDLPEKRAVTLLGYRDEQHEVVWLELTPAAAAIVQRLEAGDPLGGSVTGASADLGARIDLAEVARLLADFGGRGIVLGARE